MADLPDLPGTNTAVRANALAIIALARHHLGEDAVTPAREAFEIEPQVDLVDEAVRVAGAAKP